jgi:hypothetical protein
MREREAAMIDLEQELTSGKFGVWIEFADGTAELVNIKHMTVAKV